MSPSTIAPAAIDDTFTSSARPSNSADVESRVNGQFKSKQTQDRYRSESLTNDAYDPYRYDEKLAERSKSLLATMRRDDEDDDNDSAPPPPDLARHRTNPASKSIESVPLRTSAKRLLPWSRSNKNLKEQQHLKEDQQYPAREQSLKSVGNRAYHTTRAHGTLESPSSPQKLDSTAQHHALDRNDEPSRMPTSAERDHPHHLHQRVASSQMSSPESREPSFIDSRDTVDTTATSAGSLPALQTKGPPDGLGQLEPVNEDDPANYDLVAPPDTHDRRPRYDLETRGEKMFSTKHLQTIFDNPSFLLKFTTFLGKHRQGSVPTLIYYLDALKSIRAIRYANAVAEALDPLPGHDFTRTLPPSTINSALEDRANKAFELMAQQDLPAFITYTYIDVVSLSIRRRITGTLPPHLREASEGLAEVFCLTDPSRHDNPIVFASEEFNRTTQYGMSYAIGRNCRFLQGPRSNPLSSKRLGEAIRAGRDHSETFVNYRRDGSPFLNLLMVSPLRDSRGKLRYFIGAQVDVSGLAKECTELPALRKMIIDEEDDEEKTDPKDEFQELSEMFNLAELEIVKKSGGRMHREHVEETEDSNASWHRPRLLLKEPGQEQETETNGDAVSNVVHGKLSGVYSHYLLVRPYPSLRILFTSPSLRVPGILQSPFMDRIGSSERVRQELVAAMAEGRGVTAKIRWVSRADGEGRNRWIHCTPLLGTNHNVGVWMVVLVDDETSKPNRRFRPAPPVAEDISGAREHLRTGGSRPRTSESDASSLRSSQRGSEFDFRVT